MSNRYFICSRHRPPVEIDIAEDRPVPDAEIAYFIRGFRILEATHEFDGNTVCFAWSSRIPIPYLGERTIAFIYGDEHCRIPAYAGRVRAVMKCHGLFPPFLPHTRPLRLVQIEAAEYLRNLALWAPTGWRWLLSGRIRARCHVLPMGYGIPEYAPPLPFAERRYVTSFYGSVAPPEGFLRRLVGTPKAYSRSRLVEALRGMERRYGPERVKVCLTGGFQESLREGPGYSMAMADSKICVAPRGTTPESWRLCDGLRAGCVVITDRLVPHPWYKDSPILRIDDWRDLPDLVEDLLRDPDRMQDLHQRSLRYWHEVLSEPVLARRYASALGLQERARTGAEQPVASAGEDGEQDVAHAHAAPSAA